MSTEREEKKKKVIEALNKARSMELYAISQYMSQHYLLDGMDYGELAKNMKLIAIDEMRHAESFAERIMELGGEPTTTPDKDVAKKQSVEVIHSFDSSVEDNVVSVYNQLLKVCRDNNDNESAKVFEAIIAEEEMHWKYFDNISKHIKELGANYLSKIAGTVSSTGPASKGFANQTTTNTAN